ncbi:hypothetical protein MBLNU459_g4730t1 [Dothideomycetes sp. NU459]
MPSHLDPGQLAQIPRQVLAISPVSSNPAPGARGFALPLNLIALIVAHIEDIADIARVTRTCRLMYYMTIPQLYERVSLRSYAEVRYVDGRPEGFGGGSPFCMALSGLATSNSSNLVKDFSVAGAWPEPQKDNYLRGLVPDSTMLLAISMRAAVDKMTNMASFSWELDTKPLRTLYHGLAARLTLTSLTLQFPSDRSPRPVVTIPPIPNLRFLRVTNIDPLCYPDDISVLLFGSKKLEDLRIQWSSRMREAAEPSTDLRTYFGKCLEAKHKIPVKHIGLQNFYGTNTGDLSRIADPETIRSADLISTFGGSRSGPATIFIDETWKNVPDGSYFRNFKKTRCNETSSHHAKILASFSGLEELYIVNAQPESSASPSARNGHSRSSVDAAISPESSSSATKTPTSSYSSPSKSQDQINAALCKDYLHAITTRHGKTMKKLLLSDQWALNGEQISEIVSACPKLEQLGLALSHEEGNALRILAPFLKNLQAIRILNNPYLYAAMQEDPDMAQALRKDLETAVQYWKMPPTTTIQWCGIADAVFKLGPCTQMPEEDGMLVWKKKAVRMSLDDVKDIDIWKLDVLDI